ERPVDLQRRGCCSRPRLELWLGWSASMVHRPRAWSDGFLVRVAVEGAAGDRTRVARGRAALLLLRAGIGLAIFRHRGVLGAYGAHHGRSSAADQRDIADSVRWNGTPVRELGPAHQEQVALGHRRGRMARVRAEGVIIA